MKPRLVPRTAVVLMLAIVGTALGIGDDRRVARERDGAPDESGFRRITAADCSFERDPDAYLTAFRREIEGLSTRTERVVRGVERSQQALGMSEEVPSRGTIDDRIFGKMREDGVPHAPLATDAEFMRRVTLDLTGRIPSGDDVRNFLADDNPKKRSDLIAKLTASPEFVDKWTMFYGDLLRNVVQGSTGPNLYAEGRNSLYKTIKAFLENETPYDVFVRALITADGSNWEWGGADYIYGMTTAMGPAQDTYDTFAVRTATQFLGLGNLDCLLCHDGKGHLEKLNSWATGVTRKEAWELSAHFSRVRSARSPNLSTTGGNLYYWTISEAAAGDYLLNTTSGNRSARSAINGSNIIKPRYIFSTTQETGGNNREKYANSLTHDRQFARAAVNYLWKEMMGLGIVEPADQFDLKRLDPGDVPEGWTLQPSHPELLEELTDDFIRSGYDIRHVLETIADSSAYQLSSRFVGEWKIDYATYFARKFTRRLWSEEVHDAICSATGILNNYTIAGALVSLPTVQRAMQLPDTQEPRANTDNASTFMNYFMRGNRDTLVRSDEATILQSLNMMNNNFVLRRVRNSTANSTVNKLLADRTLTDDGLVEELFLRTLSRYPTAAERKAAVAALKTNRTQGAENLHWALMNKVDFLYNY